VSRQIPKEVVDAMKKIIEEESRRALARNTRLFHVAMAFSVINVAGLAYYASKDSFLAALLSFVGAAICIIDAQRWWFRMSAMERLLSGMEKS
jgi:hypothetical protein